ncbi:hypothetical protein [Paenibacillus pectinilyticus]|nr:hypothetical protein [Paenibacillus pectinilyticus]
MLLISLVLFRIRVKPYWKQISLAVLASSMLTLYMDTPIILVCTICILLMFVWKYQFVPALFIAISGYIMAALVSTLVIVCVNFTQAEAYIDIKDDLLISIVTRCLILAAKCGFLLALYKLRLGFTFISNYTKIPLGKENVGIYLYIIVAVIGMVYRNAFRDHVFSAVMPIQMLSMAIVLFLYVMLSKEFGLHCRSTRG